MVTVSVGSNDLLDCARRPWLSCVESDGAIADDEPHMAEVSLFRSIATQNHDIGDLAVIESPGLFSMPAARAPFSVVIWTTLSSGMPAIYVSNQPS